MNAPAAMPSSESVHASPAAGSTAADGMTRLRRLAWLGLAVLFLMPLADRLTGRTDPWSAAPSPELDAMLVLAVIGCLGGSLIAGRAPSWFRHGRPATAWTLGGMAVVTDPADRTAPSGRIDRGGARLLTAASLGHHRWREWNRHRLHRERVIRRPGPNIRTDI